MKLNQQPRRTFLATGISALFATVFASLPKIGLARNASHDEKGIIVRENEGIHILTGRRKVPLTVKLSKSNNKIESLSFCKEEQSPGRKMRVHKHLENDELIFIQKGQGRLTLGEETFEVNSGDLAFVPRGVWHGLDNTGNENLHMIFQYTPAGFEQYFIENGTVEGMPVKERTPEEYAATEKKYGIIYKDSF